MTYVKITDKDGNPIDNSNPLPVVTDIQIGSVTATDVTIKDPVTSTNKLAVNADGSINVQLTGSIAEQVAHGGLGGNRAARTGTLAAATTETLLDTTSAVIIETLEFFTSDETNGRLRISLYDKAGVARSLLHAFEDSGGFSWGGDIRPIRVRTSKCAFLDLVVDQTGRYKLHLTKQIVAPNGAKIEVINASGGSAISVTAVANYREME